MPPHKCSYIWCENTSDKKSMFRFPWNNRRRLNIWLNNCGNKTIDHLPPEQLRSRYLCIDHFDEKYINIINTKDGKRKWRLRRLTAVPEPYNVGETENISHSYKPDRAKLPPKYDTRLDSALLTNIELESAKLSNEQTDVTRDNDDTVSIPPTSKSDKLPDENSGFKCYNCEGDINGFRYTCVQCADVDLCGACEARGGHATHYVLRIPGYRPQGEVCRMVSAVREAVARALFPRGLPVNVPEPEIINPEVKEDIEDPLKEDPNWRPHEMNILEDTVLHVPLKEEPDETSDITASDMDTAVPEHYSLDLETVVAPENRPNIRVQEYPSSEFNQTEMACDNRSEKPSSIRVKEYTSSDFNQTVITPDKRSDEPSYIRVIARANSSNTLSVETTPVNRPDEPVDTDIRVTVTANSFDMFSIETELAPEKGSDTTLYPAPKRFRKYKSKHKPWQEVNKPPIIVTMTTQPKVDGCAPLPSSLSVPSSSSSSVPSSSSSVPSSSSSVPSSSSSVPSSSSSSVPSSSSSVPSSSSPVPSLSQNQKIKPNILPNKPPSSNSQKTKNLPKKPPIILNRML